MFWSCIATLQARWEVIKRERLRIFYIIESTSFVPRGNDACSCSSFRTTNFVTEIEFISVINKEIKVLFQRTELKPPAFCYTLLPIQVHLTSGIQSALWLEFTLLTFILLKCNNVVLWIR